MDSATIRLAVMCALISGCSVFSTNIKTSVTLENGEVIEVSSKSDAIVTFEKGETKLTVDNRGRPGFIEQIFGAILINPRARRNAED